jgi:AraC-like DNA-binding protein
MAFAATRHLPSRLPVDFVGQIPAKRDWLDEVFSRFAFSIILSGSGTYQAPGGPIQPVIAPCVFVQRPGEVFRYGPDRQWEEVYITYLPAQRGELERMGFIVPDRPLWYVGDSRPMLNRLAELRDLLPRVGEPGLIDRIDRVCELLLVESLVHRAASAPDERGRALEAIRVRLERDPVHPVDQEELARQHGLAPSTFRRLWQQRFGVPPARYQAQVRMYRACRLLRETDRAVADIAAEVGYADPLHFSRRFRTIIGTTATAYRAGRRNR